MLKKRSSERVSDRRVRFPSGTAVRSAGRPAGHAGSEHDRTDGLCVPERGMRTPASSPAMRGCCLSPRRTIRGPKTIRRDGTGDCRRRARAFSCPAVSRPVLSDVPVPFVRTPDPLRLPPHGFCVSGLSARPDDAFPDELFRPDPLVGRPCPFRGGRVFDSGSPCGDFRAAGREPSLRRFSVWPSGSSSGPADGVGPLPRHPLRRDDKKQARDTASLFSWRKVRDSNPRNHIRSSTDFESVPFDHSGNFPGTKIITSRIFDTPRRIFCIKSSLREDVRCMAGAGRRAASQGFCSGVRRGGGCRSGPAFVIF